MWWTLYLTCYLTGGWGSAWAGAKALRNKALDVNLLMVAAAVGAVAIGQIFDGALWIVIFATSGALDDVATRHTADSVKGLLDLAPDQAVVIEATVASGWCRPPSSSWETGWWCGRASGFLSMAPWCPGPPKSTNADHRRVDAGVQEPR